MLWKIDKNQNSKWVDLIKAKYLRGKKIRDYQKGKSFSWQWSKLMDLRDLYYKGIMCLVGKGDKIRFWNDRWVYQDSLTDMVLHVGNSQLFEENITVDKFINAHN